VTTLLIDADVLVYVYSAAEETAVDWGDGEVSKDAGDPDAVWASLVSRAEDLQDAAGASRYVLCVSGAGNWRNAIWPPYKAHRKPENRPLLVDEMRARCIAAGGYQRPLLEADDILGILATHPKIIPGRKIIWSIDKDLMQIPGEHLVWPKGEEPRIVKVAPEEGRLLHMRQTLTGDSVDGYPGCPGIGPKRADDILLSAPPWGTWEEAWAAIVKAFAKKGLTEEDALKQARVARILQHTDYDFQKKETKLWMPPSSPSA
jgi:DNA polymerase-1